MAGKITLNADLYDNVLTEKLGDYVLSFAPPGFIVT